MNKSSSLITVFLVIILALVSLQLALPDSSASAATSGAPAITTSATAQTPPLPEEAQPACDPKRSVQVSGTAVVNVTPDRVLIQLGVQSNGATTTMVQAMNSSATQAVIRAVRSLGVAADDIATDWYVIEPIYESYDSLYIKGYRINNMVAITLRDVAKTSQVIAVALQAGANQVINVDFYTSELRKYRDQARKMAMQAAQEKAQALAQAAGANAQCVLTINENSWSSYNGWWPGRGQSQNQWTQNAVQNIAPSAGTASGTGDEPISLGKISVRAEVNAVFGLN